MAVYKDRKLVPVQEMWDIDVMLDGKTLQARIDEAIKLGEAVVPLFKKRHESADALFKYLETAYKAQGKMLTLGVYIYLRTQQDTIDAEAAQAQGQLALRYQPIAVAMADEDAVDIKNRAKIEGFLKQERFAPYRRNYEKVFRNIPHTLPEDQERVLARLGGAFENNVEVHSVLLNAETKYAEAVGKDGKKHELTDQTYPKLMREKDRTVRKTAYESRIAGRSGVRETAARLVGGHFLSSFRFAQLRNHPDHIAASMFTDNVTPKLVEGLYKVTKQNLGPRQRYYWARRAFVAKALGIPFKDVRGYDMGVEYVATKNKYSVKEAIDLVVKSVAPLGAEYVKAAKAGFADRWVDFHMTPNKRAGAFSYGVWSHPRKHIHMNFDEDLYSVFTLAHEMGHSLHSWHSDAKSPPPLAGYPIFIAEVASNFSELLMMEQILRAAKDDKVRYLALERFLENFDGNVYRQMEFSEYEYQTMLALKENRSIGTWQAVSDIYYGVALQYGPDPAALAKHRDAVCLAATHVPHYFYGFYVYKYTVGMIGALSLMAQLKADQKKGAANYVKFVSAGRDRWPADILKASGVDLDDPQTHERAFGLFAGYVEQFIALGEKIFKVKAPSAKWIEAEMKKGRAAAAAKPSKGK